MIGRPTQLNEEFVRTLPDEGPVVGQPDLFEVHAQVSVLIARSRWHDNARAYVG